MNKQINSIVKSIESHYNIDLGVKTDYELAEKLKSEGLPSLAKLLTMKREDLTLDRDTIHTDLLGDVPDREIFTLEGGKRFVSLDYLEEYMKNYE
jgi:hypothetical protein